MTSDSLLSHGHRKRLRERLIKSPESLQDYEVLELLLCMAQPRIDVKPIAKQLLQRFGSLGAVIYASEVNLLQVNGLGSASIAAIRLSKEVASRLLAPPKNSPILDSSRKVLEYCQSVMTHLETEQFRILYLDSKNRIIKDEVQQEGTVDHVHLYPRELMKNAMNLGAAGLIMIHNHPSGDPTPSNADKLITTTIAKLGRSLNIYLYDHIIVAQNGCFSFRAAKLLDEGSM